MKLLIKDFFSKYDKIYGKLRFCFLKKSFMKNLIFCAVLKIDFLAYFGESPLSNFMLNTKDQKIVKI